MSHLNRLVYRTVAVCAILAGLAFQSNHTTQPCTDSQIGAGGMCVTTQIGGVL